jgi:PEP-CTERM motif-containing protein
MIKQLTLIGILGSVTSPALVSADPIRIVDTGPSGPAGTRSVDWNNQWLAAEFSTSSAWRITGVEGWIVPSGLEQLGGPFRISLLGDDGDIPSSTPLFSTVTNVPGAGATGWYGQSELNWTIQPGSYWVSFEALAHTSSGPAFSGTTFFMSGATAAPLANQAFAQLLTDCNFRERSCWSWRPDDDIDLGVRIFAEPAGPIPEPSTLVLFGTAAVAAWRARKRRTA